MNDIKLEKRKIIEMQHYDNAAGKRNPAIFGVRNAVYNLPWEYCRKKYLNDLTGKRLLDFGCGLGEYSAYFAKKGAFVDAIDLSENSLQLAKNTAINKGVAEDISFARMDCENLDFEDCCFDIIFNMGTLSCLQLENAVRDWARVLKKDGMVVGIDTLGHNPIFNLNRRIKTGLGLRTKWMQKHVLRTEDFKIFKRYFDEAEIRFFILSSALAAPFAGIKYLNGIVSHLDRVDSFLFRHAFFRKQAFKVLFVLKKPRKDEL